MAVNVTTEYLRGYDGDGDVVLNGTAPSAALLPDDGVDDGVLAVALNVPYVASEAMVAVMAVAGNALVILAFKRDRRLRRRTNYYIVSLAAADLLVGLLGVPFAVLASLGLPRNLYACLFTVSLLVVLCTTSIFCLLAVSVDRYWAILYPLGYSRNVSTKKAIGIICVCWAAGSLVGFLPLLGWHQPRADAHARCFFTGVMEDNYLVFLYFFTIIFPGLILAAFYAHIYQVVLKQLRRMERQSPGGGIRGGAVCGVGGGTMLRVLGAARKREVKATQNLSIIVLFFVVCWFPLYTINCVKAFCQDCYVPPAVMDCCIILSHLNSAGNPLLYAYHLKDFRAALRALLLGPADASEAVCSSRTAATGGGGGEAREARWTGSAPQLTPRNALPDLPLPSISTTTRVGPLQPPADDLWSFSPASLADTASPVPPAREDSDGEGRLTAGGHLCTCTQQQPRIVAAAAPPLQGSLTPRSSRSRLSPLRVVGEILFNSSCSGKEEVIGKAGRGKELYVVNQWEEKDAGRKQK